MDLQSSHGLLESLRTLSPLLLLLLFYVVSVVDSVLTVRKAKKNGPGNFCADKRSLHQQIRGWMAIKRCLKWLSVGALVTYIADTLIYIIHVRMAWSEHWWGGESMVIYLVCSVCLYIKLLMTLLAAQSPPVTSFACWIAAIPIELGILATSLTRYVSVHREPAVGNPHGGPVRENITIWEFIQVASTSVRVVILFTLALLYTCKFIPVKAPHNSETTWLLGPDMDCGIVMDRSCESTSGTWWDYFSLYSPIWACMWPSKSGYLQFVVAACTFLLVLEEGLKALSTAQLGVLITALAKQQGADVKSTPWLEALKYAVLHYLPIFLNIIRSALWIPINSYTYRELSMAGLRHAYSLDLEYHQSKKTGEVASALNKCKSITEFQEQIVREFVPVILSLIVAFQYFLFVFDAYYALMIALSSVFYVYVTIRMAKWRAEAKREMTNVLKEELIEKAEQIELYKHVKVCGAEQPETERYAGVLEESLRLQSATKLRGTVQNLCQSCVSMACFLGVCCIALYQVSIGSRSVGDFIQVITYVSQLLKPLSSFAQLYDRTQTALINAERMLEVLGTEPTVADRRRDVPMGKEITGTIHFENVTFSWKGRTILKGFTYTFQRGETTAIVGQSGGGKSTIFDLICGFHKFEGKITIDGYDIMEYDLRKHIAVVLQDTPLFNQTLMDNLKCGNLGATDEEIMEACRKVATLDKINKVPGGFNALAGHRGQNLSGGQKQCVAVTRALIANAAVLLLDEATSALDAKTAKDVLKSLANTSCGRTTLIIAHQLGTITEADRILVLDGGRIVESGTHEELVELKRLYACLWDIEQSRYSDPRRSQQDYRADQKS